MENVVQKENPKLYDRVRASTFNNFVTGPVSILNAQGYASVVKHEIDKADKDQRYLDQNYLFSINIDIAEVKVLDTAVPEIDYNPDSGVQNLADYCLNRVARILKQLEFEYGIEIKTQARVGGDEFSILVKANKNKYPDLKKLKELLLYEVKNQVTNCTQVTNLKLKYVEIIEITPEHKALQRRILNCGVSLPKDFQLTKDGEIDMDHYDRLLSLFENKPDKIENNLFQTFKKEHTGLIEDDKFSFKYPILPTNQLASFFASESVKKTENMGFGLIKVMNFKDLNDALSATETDLLYQDFLSRVSNDLPDDLDVIFFRTAGDLSFAYYPNTTINEQINTLVETFYKEASQINSKRIENNETILPPILISADYKAITSSPKTRITEQMLENNSLENGNAKVKVKYLNSYTAPFEMLKSFEHLVKEKFSRGLTKISTSSDAIISQDLTCPIDSDPEYKMIYYQLIYLLNEKRPDRLGIFIDASMNRFQAGALDLFDTLQQTNFYLSLGVTSRAEEETPLSLPYLQTILNNLKDININPEVKPIQTVIMQQNLFKIFAHLRLMMRTLFFKSVYLNKIPNQILNKIATEKNHEFETYWLDTLIPLCKELDSLINGCMIDLDINALKPENTNLIFALNNYFNVKNKMEEKILLELGARKLRQMQHQNKSKVGDENIVTNATSLIFSHFEQLNVSACIVINNLNIKYEELKNQLHTAT